jgi:hypothetical protein
VYDIVFNLPEIWHVLHHFVPKFKVKVIVFPNLLSEFLENYWVFCFGLEEDCFAHGRQGAVRSLVDDR